jgi:hypothetical protein
MQMRSVTKLACAAIAMCATAPCVAEEVRWYVGVNAGTGSSGLEDADFLEFVRAAYSDIQLGQQSFATTQVDDGDMTWSILAGVQIFRYLALEISYVDLGETTFVYTGTVARTDGQPLPPSTTVRTTSVQGELRATSSGIGLKALGKLPLGEHFDLHAQAGLFKSDTRFVLNAPGAPLALWKFGREVEDDSQEAFYGIGVGYRFGDRWAISADWQRFADVGIGADAINEEYEGYVASDALADAETLTLAVTFSF